LTAEAAQALGLTTATTVSVSGIDAHAGMVGINALEPGTLALIMGSSTCQLALSQEPIFDDGIWGPFESAVVPGAWVAEAGQASTGSTVRWLIDLVDGTALGSPPAGDRYARVEALAAAVPPGAAGLTLLDHWQGSRTPIRDANARGAITGLTLAHGPGHLLRAVYEGTAYGNRRVLSCLADLGVPIARIIACGGGTRSRLWLQILADVAGIAIELTDAPDAVTLGSAICAAVGAGAYADLQSAAGAMVRSAAPIRPDEHLGDTYDRGYSRYIATYDALHRVRVAHGE
jgi:ribulose kinase